MSRKATFWPMTVGAVALGGTGLALAIARKNSDSRKAEAPGDYQIVPAPPDAMWLKVSSPPPGTLDSGQFFADWFNANNLQGSDQTASQRSRLLAALVGLGADLQGYVTWRPTSTQQLTALAIGDQFERETGKGAEVAASGLRRFVELAAALPENPLRKITGV